MLRSIQERSLFAILPRPSKAEDKAGTSRLCSAKTACKTPGQIAAVSSARGVSVGLTLTAWAGCRGRPAGLRPLLLALIATRELGRRAVRFISFLSR